MVFEELEEVKGEQWKLAVGGSGYGKQLDEGMMFAWGVTFNPFLSRM